SGEALRRAGLTAATADPPGGEILRDEAGAPSGVLLERAADLVTRLIPPPPAEEVARAIEAATPIAHRAGLAGVTCPEGIGDYRASRLPRDRGRLRLRVGIPLATSSFDEEVDIIRREGRGDDWLHWSHLKLFADGALGPRTAWMIEPYLDDPANTGI